MAKLIDVEGIGETYAEKLKSAGVSSTDSLLKRCSSAAGRKELAAKCGISESKILEWANRCDLLRIKGVGSEYADLLEEAGVDTVAELAQRNAKNLYERLVSANAAKKLVRKLPVESQLADWVQQAKALPRMLTY